MALAQVQAFSAPGSGFVNTVTTAASGSATTGGNAIVAVVFAQAGANDISSVTDNKGNTYTRIYQGNNTTSVDVELWIARGITGGASHTVTANDSGFLVAGVIALEISGLATGNIVDSSNKVAGTSAVATAFTVTTSATTNVNDILIAVAALATNTGTWTGTTGYGTAITQVSTTTNINMLVQTKVVSATGTQTAGPLNTANGFSYESMLVCLSDTTLAGGAVSHRLTLLGVGV
jgi:hypothetical protein